MELCCPSCQKVLRLPANAAGKRVKCPACAAVFQAKETAEDIQAGPPPARANKSQRHMPPEEEEQDIEETPRRRRRRREDEEDYDEEDSRPRSRRRDDDEVEEGDDDYDDGKSRRRKARRGAKNASLWFLIAGIVTLAMVVLNIGSNLYVSARFGGAAAHPNAAAQQGAQAGQIVGLLGCGLIGIAGAIYQFQASASLKSLRGKGKVTAAIVFGFIFGVLFGIGVVINLALMSRLPADFPSGLVVLAIAAGAITSLVNLLAAILGIVTLNNPAVSRAFRRSSGDY
jgi:hypothetical protein